MLNEDSNHHQIPHSRLWDRTVYGNSHCFTEEVFVSTLESPWVSMSLHESPWVSMSLLPSMRSTGMTCSCSSKHKLWRTALLPVSAETYLFGTCSNYAKESTGEMHELSWTEEFPKQSVKIEHDFVLWALPWFFRRSSSVLFCPLCLLFWNVSGSFGLEPRDASPSPSRRPESDPLQRAKNMPCFASLQDIWQNAFKHMCEQENVDFWWLLDKW